MSGNPTGGPPSEAAEDEAELIAGLRAGDHAAYQELLRLYGDRLYSMLYQLAGGDAELAAEFTQEAFVRAWQRLHQFDGRCRLYTWLYRLGRNRALDILAKKRPAALAPELLGAVGPVSRDADELAETENSQRLQQAVQQALAELPAAQRELILMRDFDGADYEQIASALEVPLGTVKSRLNRARLALKAAVARKLPEDWR